MTVRIGRLAKGLAVAALLVATTSHLRAQPAAAATSLPYHDVARAACFGGGNGDPAWNFIDVTVPVVYAYNAHPASEDHQSATWRARLVRWTGTGWVQVANQITPWSALFTVTDGQGGWQAFENYVPGTRLYPDKLGYEYRVLVDIYWYASGTVPYAFSDTIMPDVHLHQTGTYWIPGDPVSGSHSSTVCDYIPDIGQVPLPAL
jgi:hypothetical protein